MPLLRAILLLGLLIAFWKLIDFLFAWLELSFFGLVGLHFLKRREFAQAKNEQSLSSAPLAIRPRFVTFLGLTGLLVTVVPLFSALTWVGRLIGPSYTIEQAMVVIGLTILQLLIFAWGLATSIGLLRLRRWAIFTYLAACVTASTMALMAGSGAVPGVVWTAVVMFYFSPCEVGI
jgi:hypothetical protein